MSLSTPLLCPPPPVDLHISSEERSKDQSVPLELCVSSAVRVAELLPQEQLRVSNGTVGRDAAAT
jgi:hypothetical protein